MYRYWDVDAPFIRLWGPEHGLYAAGMVALLAALLLGRSWVRAHQGLVRRVVVGVIVAQQLALYTWYAVETGFDLSESLPLHISRVSTLLALAYFLTGRRAVMDVLFSFGLFAYLSFASPQRVYAPWHLVGMSFFVNHVVTILAPVFAAVCDRWRPTAAGLVRSYGWFLVYLGVVLAVNPMVDGNYFYLKYRPVLRSWPFVAYLVAVVVATAALFGLGYLVGRFLTRRSLRGEPSIPG